MESGPSLAPHTPRAYTLLVGRIVVPVRVENSADRSKSMLLDALVDTGASHLVLPKAWRDRLGALETVRTISLELATQALVEGDVCGPVRIQIEGFPPVFSELLFVDMEPGGGGYEPLLGYIVLEQSQAAVDLLGQRLVHVKRMDLK